MATRSFSITGDTVPASGSEYSNDGYSLESAVTITPPSRDGTNLVQFELDDNSLACFEFSDGTVWFADQDTIFDVFPELDESFRSVSREAGKQGEPDDGVSVEAAKAPAPEISYAIPTILFNENKQRGVGDILLKVVRIFKRKAKDDILDKGISFLASQLENKQLQDHLMEMVPAKDEKKFIKEGLFSIQPNFEFSGQIPAPSNKPYLLFIHGTASSTFGSFGKLYGSAAWDKLVSIYGNHILAFQHRSLTKDPLENVEDLISQLPNGAELHLVTHSRGGLIGDVLCRFCATGNGQAGFSQQELTYWREKAGDYKFAEKAERIAGLLVGKSIAVTKFVRVACPASGTTLASKRIEYFFNVTLNLLGILTGQNANPVYSAFKDLVGEILKKKDDPDALPGLSAMNPDSSFIKVLNHANEQFVIQSPLYVLAGNSQPGLNFKALAVIVTRLFFIGKNDMVVNTSSMTNGAMRVDNKVHWLFDEGNSVNHFGYFGNSKTQDALLRALQADDPEVIPDGFQPFKQKLSEGELRQAKLGIEGGDVHYTEITGRRPIAIIMPGIMGSNLSIKDRKIWINYWQFVTGGLSKLGYGSSDIKATSLIRTSYEKMARRLSSDYDVLTFAFDWRMPLKDTAKLFAEKVEVLLRHNQPIKIIAHSMGGVLVRDLMVFQPDTFKKLYQSSGFQLVFLGSPLGGSYRIPYVLFGFDGIIKTISRIDLSNSMTDLLDMFCKYRGLICLLPFTTHQNHDFAKPETWKYLSEKLGKGKWPVPDSGALKEFENYRNAVLGAYDKIILTKAVYIAGKDKETPYDYRERPDGGLEFLMTADGDQSVTWESGIPRQMTDAGNVYYAPATHGALANDPKLFDAILDILKKGSTDRLPKDKPLIRGQRISVAREFDDFDLSEAGMERTILSLGSGDVMEDAPTIVPIKINVNHGDLMYATYPVMAGHFLGDGLFSVERAIDWHLDGELGRRMQLGIYPGEIGTYDLMLLSNDRPKAFKGALIIGLGESGKITSYLLSQSVEKAIIKYLSVFNSDKTRLSFTSGVVGISAPAISSGYGGLSVESSLRAIITGIQHANQNTLIAYGEKAKIIQEIEFIEIFNNKALDYFYNLTRLSRERDNGLMFTLSSKKIGLLPGRRLQTPTDETSDWWTRITVKLAKDKDENCKPFISGIRFNVGTTSAREEEETIKVNLQIIETLLEEASIENNWNEDLARTLYEMLIPNQFKEYLNKQTNVFWIVDKETAAFPWELLKNAQKQSKPLSISCGMMRQLATSNYRSRIQQVASRTAIVVADPDLQGRYSQLPGALKEGRLVEKMLLENNFNTNTLVNEKAANILVNIFSKEYKIVHLCGHGIFEKDPNLPSGMLIGKNAVLTPAEIKQMSTVPDFVFVNCCHLGAMNADTEAITQSRYKLAANLGTQLIDNGVKAVIVAGWAVDDRAALEFAEVFYRHFLSGESFADSVQKARLAAYNLSGQSNNTWGAYQTYGDPFYSLDISRQTRQGKAGYNFVMESQVEMELYNLMSKQETGTYKDDEIRKPLDAIKDTAEKLGLLSVKSMEYAARISANLDDYATSIKWYERMLKSNKANFDVASLEQFCNIRAKYAVEQVKHKIISTRAAQKMLKDALNDISSLINMGVNGERLGMKGSTLKRMAQIETGDAKKTAMHQALQTYKEALTYYQQGWRYYPLANWLNLLSISVHLKIEKWGKDKVPGKSTVTQMVEDELKACVARAASSDDYWDRISVANMLLTAYLINPDQTRVSTLKSAYERVWANAGTKGQVKAEIEHFDSLMDLLQTSGEKGSKLCEEILGMLKDLSAFSKKIWEEKSKVAK